MFQFIDLKNCCLIIPTFYSSHWRGNSIVSLTVKLVLMLLLLDGRPYEEVLTAKLFIVDYYMCICLKFRWLFNRFKTLLNKTMSFRCSYLLRFGKIMNLRLVNIVFLDTSLRLWYMSLRVRLTNIFELWAINQFHTNHEKIPVFNF